MRVNSIMPSLMTKVYKSKNVDSPETTIEKPIATDTVQFKGEAACVSRIKSLANGAQSLWFSPTVKVGRAKNEATIVSFYNELCKSIKEFPDCYKHPKFNSLVLPYLEGKMFLSVRRLVLEKLKLESRESISLVDDSKGNSYCMALNLGGYSFWGTENPQCAICFRNPENENLIAFSNGSEPFTFAITTNRNRHEFYNVHASDYSGFQYKSLSHDGFFPVSYEKNFNKDGSDNQLHKILRKLGW